MLRLQEVPETVPALEHTALSSWCGLSTGCQARSPLIGASGTVKGTWYTFLASEQRTIQTQTDQIQKRSKKSFLNRVAQSCLTLCDPMDCCTVQTPPSMGFSRQEYWSELPFPSPGDLPDPGIEPGSPALQADSLPTELLGKPISEQVSC